MRDVRHLEVGRRTAERDSTPDDYAWLPTSLRSINVSGGEPFLRDDLVEIVARHARGVSRARGSSSRRTASSPSASRRRWRRCRTSPSGSRSTPSGEKHDEMRGIPGRVRDGDGDRRAAQGRRGRGPRAGGDVDRDESRRLTRVEEGRRRDSGSSSSSTAAHSSPIFFGEHDEERPHSDESVGEIAEIMREQLSSRKPLDWAKAYYMRGLIDYVQGKPRRLPCRAGSRLLLPRPVRATSTRATYRG